MKAQRIAFLFGCVLLGATLCLAQFETAEVLGTVTDPSGGAVAGATVTLTNQETGIQAKTTTDAQGNYDFFNVKVGRYTVTFEHAGFSKASANDVEVNVGARQRVDLAMKLGAVSEVVQVEGAAMVLDTDTSQHAQIVNAQQMVELPLNGRNYSDLALLATNVTKSPMSALFSPSATPREGALNINGMRNTYNNFLLDGLDNNAYSPSNQGYSVQVVQPSPDAIAEFKVITSNFSAEYGRVGGGVINAVLRSGSNQFHGTAYEFLRNTDLNAVGFTFSPTLFQKPTLQRNQFGVTLGGPFIKNKLFFFVDYEGQRQLQRYLNFDSLPTLNDRAGVLPFAVTNPVTGASYAANSTIPIATINPFAAKVLGDLPAPNNGPAGARANNYLALLLIRDYYDKYDAKIDYQINDRMTSFVRFSQRKDIQFYQPDIAGPSGGGGNGFIHAIQQQAAIGYTWTATTASLFEARFAFDHILAGKTPPFLGGQSMQALYGIPGLSTSSGLTGGLNTQNIGGIVGSIGRQATNPQFQNPTSFNPKFNYSLIKGRHSLKAGYEFVAVRTEVLDVNPLYGLDGYTGQFSKPAGGTGDSTTYNIADFIFGLPNTIGLGSNFVSNQRQHIHSLYAQDDYRITPKLTLNIGLRWEFATPIWERDNRWTNFDPASNTLVQAKSGDLFSRSLQHPDYKDFGPRIGASYSINSKTVVRAGYGISYSFFNRVGSALENLNPPYAIFGSRSQSAPSAATVASGAFLTTQNSFTVPLADASAFNPITSNIDYVDPNTKWTMLQSWLFSVQRQVTSNTMIELAYNGNHATRLPIIADYNQAFPNPVVAGKCDGTVTPAVTSGCLGVQARRPDQSWGAITWVDPAGSNSFNGLSLRAEHRTGHGLYLLNSFTWSKALGNSEQALEAYPGYTVANPQNVRNLAQERGPTSFDITFNNVTSAVYQLPFGKGRKFANHLHPVMEALFGGWEMNAINTAHTGSAINVNYGAAASNDVTGSIADYRGLGVLRPNVSGSGIDQSKGALVNTYFAGYTFTIPSVNNPFGNLGRDAFRAPGLWQLDTGINKSFRVRESMSVQFRSEFFNILNKTNFSPPNATTTSAAFGTIRSTYPPRQVQFALKLLF